MDCLRSSELPVTGEYVRTWLATTWWDAGERIQARKEGGVLRFCGWEERRCGQWGFIGSSSEISGLLLP